VWSENVGRYQSPEAVLSIETFPKALCMIRSLVLSIVGGLALANLCGADETFPVVHTDPITVRVLDGRNGKPIPHAQLTLVGGYDKEDFKRQSWQEAALTDSQGYVHLSNEMANLPFLQVWVLKYPTCQQKPKAAMFSTDEIRRDGLSTPNRCGISTVASTHGVFIVFVNSKLTHDLLSLHPFKKQ